MRVRPSTTCQRPHFFRCRGRGRGSRQEDPPGRRNAAARRGRERGGGGGKCRRNGGAVGTTCGFSRASAFLRDLSTILGGRVLRSPPGTRRERAWQTQRRTQTVAVACTTARRWSGGKWRFLATPPAPPSARITSNLHEAIARRGSDALRARQPGAAKTQTAGRWLENACAAVTCKPPRHQPTQLTTQKSSPAIADRVVRTLPRTLAAAVDGGETGPAGAPDRRSRNCRQVARTCSTKLVDPGGSSFALPRRPASVRT
jgi:hypothetical protein